MSNDMEKKVNCKCCGNSCKYGDLVWLNGKTMCPRCYIKKRSEEERKSRA